MLPTFLVIGAQKAGTTSLHASLGAHPDIFVTRVKELNFFTELEYHRGIDWYEAQFAAAGAAAARGEVSPFYTSYPWMRQVPERVAEHLPDVRLVYVLRDPVERMLSNYRHHVAIGTEVRAPEIALLADTWQYLDRSSYSMQLEQWLPHFSREQLLLVTAEALRDAPAPALRQIVGFVGADPTRMPGVTATLNRAEEHRSDRGAVARLRRSPVWPALRGAVPAGIRRRAWARLGSRPLDERVRRLDLEPELRAAIVDRLRPDLARLPGHLASGPSYVGTGGEPGRFDCWGLLDDARAT